MFVVGAIAGVVAGGVILGYDDHSNHSNWQDYSDAEMVKQEEEAKAEEERLERQLATSRQELQEVFDDQMARLKEKYPDISVNPKDAEEFMAERNHIIADMKAKLSKESEEAQKRVDDINRAIAEINKIHLGEK